MLSIEEICKIKITKTPLTTLNELLKKNGHFAEAESRKEITIPIKRIVDGNELTTDVTFKISSYIGIEVHGQAASHTGFQSLGFVHDNDELNCNLLELAEKTVDKRITTNSQYPFLVGKEHAEFGWKPIAEWKCYKQPNPFEGMHHVEIKVPYWIEEKLVQVMTNLGCEFNGREKSMRENIPLCWHTRPIEDVKMLLKPLLKNSTRLTNQDNLAQELEAYAIEHGFLSNSASNVFGAQMGQIGFDF